MSLFAYLFDEDAYQARRAARNEGVEAAFANFAEVFENEQGQFRADLTRVERERDMAQSAMAELSALYDSATAETARVARQRDEERAAHIKAMAALHTSIETRARLVDRAFTLRGQRDDARTELAKLRAELARRTTTEGGTR